MRFVSHRELPCETSGESSIAYTWNNLSMIYHYGDRLDFNKGEVQSSIQFDLGKLNSNFDESPKQYEINGPAVR